MRVRAIHHTVYHYEKPVSFSPHTVRLHPRPAPHLEVRSQTLEVKPSGNLMPGLDLHGNIVTTIFIPEATLEFGAMTRLELDVRPFNPFNFLVADHALTSPFRYEPDEQRGLAAYLAPLEPLLTLPFFTMPNGPEPTVETLVAITQAMHDHIAYERRDEGDARSAHATVAARSGACRDTAVLLAEYLRQQGVAARIVSGYLCEFDVEEAKRVAQGALHAWTEAYLPGAGWIGLDGTNGVLCNENFIPLAAGLVPDDISPLSGRYYHAHAVGSRMTTELSLIPL